MRHDSNIRVLIGEDLLDEEGHHLGDERRNLLEVLSHFDGNRCTSMLVPEQEGPKVVDCLGALYQNLVLESVGEAAL